jgi:hypothetical protein
MALLLKGGEFVTTEAISASILKGLINLARLRPVILNGIKFHAEDLLKLAEEAQKTGRPVWIRASLDNMIQLP